MQEFVTNKQKHFLTKIIPNAVQFCNKFTSWPINDIKYLRKTDYNTILEYLHSMGCYFPKTVDPSKHELTLLKEYKGMRVYNQKNLHKGTEMIVAVLSRIMIIDIDDKTLEETIYLLKQKPQLNFKVYKTTKGYHAYCINNYFSHKDLKTLQTMKDCGCDEIYIHFCNEYGFVTRMSKKTLNETYIEKFECYVINDEENRSIKGIEDIVNLKDVVLDLEKLDW